MRCRFLVGSLFTLFIGYGMLAAEDTAPNIELVPAALEKPASIVVHGLSPPEVETLARLPPDDPKWREIFSVRVAGAGDVPAMLGRYVVENGQLRFTPSFPLEKGLKYLAVLRLETLALTPKRPAMEQTIVIPAGEKPPPAKVLAVYPTADKLPENQLRFYIQFSAPMSRGEVYERVSLLDDKGQEVSFPFLELNEELWNPTGDRVTLLCDPGRVKRGLRPREEDGPILVEGKRYTLVVDRRWTDAHGQPLVDAYRKTFEVLPPVNGAVDVGEWKLSSPPAGTKAPLVVRFPRPLDHGCLLRMLTVCGPDGQPLAGKIATSAHETQWEFTPDAAWTPGAFHLVADTALEDLAGNNIERPFEVDLFGPVTARTLTETVRIPFQVR